MRLDRPIGIWLLLWPMLWALWVSADGRPDERLFVIFVIGTLVMRSAGCVINDFADREFDAHVQAHGRPAAREAVGVARRGARAFRRAGARRARAGDPLNRRDAVLALSAAGWRWPIRS